MNASVLSRVGLHFGFVDHILPVASYYLRPCFSKNFPNTNTPVNGLVPASAI